MKDALRNTGIPVYDICSLNHQGQLHQELIAERFADYLLVHPNLHKAHRHSFYHVVLFTQGAGFHTIDFEQFPVQAGDLYFMRPGQVHSWNFEGAVDGFIVNFSEELFSSLLTDKQYMERFTFFRGVAKDSVLHLSETALAACSSIMEQVLQEAQNRNTYGNEMICAQLLSLFITVSRDSNQLPAGTEPQQGQLILYQFKKLLEQYYTEKRLPKEYATMLYLTPNHLNAVCKDLLGKPAGTLIRDRILLEAKRLLVNADLGIAEIAYQLNFTDNSYFTKFFKKYTGLTPEDFRRVQTGS